MSTLLTEITNRARELSAEDRAQLAQLMLESVLERCDAHVDLAWDIELAARVRAYEIGVATLIPAEDVFAQARLLTQ